MNSKFPIGQKINLSGHFNEPVILESVREIFGGYELQVRLSDGSLDEAILSTEEAAAISDKVEETAKSIRNICPEETSFNKIALPTQKGYILIQLNTIVYCQAESNYCKIFCNNKKEFLVSKTLKYVEELLDNELFIRIHKSFLVNLNYVAGYDKTNDLKVTLLNGMQLPVSVRKKEQFLNAILKK